MKRRITARTADDACARIWDKHPEALAVVIRYLYCGWWEYQVIGEVSV